MASNPNDKNGDGKPDESYTYSLEGQITNAFVVDSASGQIKVKSGAALDYETKNTYSGKVKWTLNGWDVAANLTIKVSEVLPGKPSIPQFTRTEFPAAEYPDGKNPALDVTWTVPDTTGVTVNGFEAQYCKQGNVGWTDYNGNLTATDTSINLADLDAGATYEVRVRAETNEGDGPWSDTGSGQANQLPEICCLVKGTTGRLAGIPFGAHRTRSMWTSGKRHFFTDPDGDQLT
ncbi:MAG: fibronectin type III domain-containing protein [Chloroflexota bacterium]|nr:fibronectin type III domain-containing protein [Chloroflexota bacterium]